MKRFLAGLFFAVFLLYNGNALAESALSAILIEAETGRVLYENNAHAPLPMASTTKIMTALLALERGRLEDMVTASRNAFGVPGTSIYLSEGEQLTLEEMLYGLMLSSGNDAAVAIAEHIGGSVENFCRMMTQRAESLNCENTVFQTPHGLPCENHHTTARDLALIAREAMKNETFRQIVSTQRASIPWEGHAYHRILNNKNRLLSSYPGALGVKTGYTKAAGRCLVFAAEREGMRLIGVVLNAPNWFEDAAEILDNGFKNWQMVTLLSEGEAVRALPVKNSGGARVTVRALKDVSAPVGTDRWPVLRIDLPDALEAGVEKGQAVGTASLWEGDMCLISVPLYADQAMGGDSFRAGLSRIGQCWELAP